MLQNKPFFLFILSQRRGNTAPPIIRDSRGLCFQLCVLIATLAILTTVLLVHTHAHAHAHMHTHTYSMHSGSMTAFSPHLCGKASFYFL